MASRTARLTSDIVIYILINSVTILFLFFKLHTAMINSNTFNFLSCTMQCDKNFEIAPPVIPMKNLFYSLKESSLNFNPTVSDLFFIVTVSRGY